MKYFSEVTNQVYDTPEALEEAEKVVLEEQKAKEEKLAKRAERAKEVNEAYEVVAEAKRHADELLNEFLKDYGSYHKTIRTPVRTNNSMSELAELFNSIFRDIIH